MDTIFAQATAHGRAGVSIVRLSGPQAFDISSQFCDRPAVGKTGLRAIRASDGSLVDRALVLCFEAGASLLVNVLWNFMYMEVWLLLHGC